MAFKLAGICEGSVWEAGVFKEEIHLKMWKAGYEDASGWPDEGTLVDQAKYERIRQDYEAGEYNVWLDTGDPDEMIELLDAIFGD